MKTLYEDILKELESEFKKKKFRQLWMFNAQGVKYNASDNVWKYFENALTRVRQETLEECLSAAPEKKNNGFSSDQSWNENRGFNQALSEYKNKIKAMQK